jgi:hypothetical protein
MMQVFVSSSSSDLREQRSALLAAIVRGGRFPAGMEQWAAADVRALDIIQRHIDQSDVVVVVSAGRYGSLLDGRDISYTEHEFEYARSKGKPTFVFLHRESEQLIHELRATDADSAERLSRFHDRLKQSHRTIRTWSTSDELSNEVLRALQETTALPQSAGWVRLDELDQAFADTVTQKRIVELQDWNFALLTRLSEIMTNAREFGRDLPKASEQAAPNIQGLWVAKGKFNKLRIFQRDSMIAGYSEGGAFDHILHGFWIDDRFSYEIWRINKRSQGFTIMYGILLAPSAKRIITQVEATDGAQELKKGFKERLEWDRLEDEGAASTIGKKKGFFG